MEKLVVNTVLVRFEMKFHHILYFYRSFMSHNVFTSDYYMIMISTITYVHAYVRFKEILFS